MKNENLGFYIHRKEKILIYLINYKRLKIKYRKHYVFWHL